jgi:hypothetical protein
LSADDFLVALKKTDSLHQPLGLRPTPLALQMTPFVGLVQALKAGNSDTELDAILQSLRGNQGCRVDGAADGWTRCQQTPRADWCWDTGQPGPKFPHS